MNPPSDPPTPVTPPSTPFFGETDAYLLGEGTHARLYDRLGGHLAPGGEGAMFAVWAPNARSISVIGEWNGWDPQADLMLPRADSTGVWEARSAHARHGNAYKYRIVSQSGRILEKADPLATWSEPPPATACTVAVPV